MKAKESTTTRTNSSAIAKQFLATCQPAKDNLSIVFAAANDREGIAYLNDRLVAWTDHKEPREITLRQSASLFLRLEIEQCRADAMLHWHDYGRARWIMEVSEALNKPMTKNQKKRSI